MKKSVTLIVAFITLFGSLVSVGETKDAPSVPVYSMEELDKKPVPLVRRAPVYPKKEKRNRVQATVDIEFIIDSVGKVSSPKVLKFTLNHPKAFESEEAYVAVRKAFSDSATTAVVEWKYEPGRKNGKAVATKVELPLSYTLRR